MPFDGTKAVLGESESDLIDHGQEMIGSFIHQTGEDVTGPTYKGSWNGLTFTVSRESGRVEMNGSFHKFFNEGKHNYNDFSIPDFLSVLKSLNQGRGINPCTAKLHNIEFGVNIVLPYDPTEVILKSLITYKGKPFERFTTGKGDGYQCVTSEFILKFYDKGRHYDCLENIVRIEVKVIKMRFLENKKIYIDKMSDLLNTDNYKKLGALLIGYFRDSLISDNKLDVEALSEKDCRLVLEGRNKAHWERKSKEVLGDRYDAESKKLERQEKRFRELNKPDWLEGFIQNIESKWSQLTSVSELEMSEIHRQVKEWECRKITDPKKGQMSENHTLYLERLSDNEAKGKKAPSLKKSKQKESVPLEDVQSTLSQNEQESQGEKQSLNAAEKKGQNQSNSDEVTKCDTLGTGSEEEELLNEITRWIKSKSSSKETLISIKNYLFQWSDSLTQLPVDKPAAVIPHHPDFAKIDSYARSIDIPSATFNVEINSRANKDGLSSLFIRVTQNRKSKKIKLDFRIPEEHFNRQAKYGKWIRTLNPRYASYNGKIEVSIEELKVKYSEIAKNNESPLDHIKKRLVNSADITEQRTKAY